MLEEALRRALADEAAAAPPALPDLAGAALRDAGRLRRRRALGAVAAGVLLVATAGLAVTDTTLRQPRRPVAAAPAPGRAGDAASGARTGPTAAGMPTWPPSIAGSGLDLMAAGALSTLDGRRIRLPDPALTAAYRVPLGWLAFSASDPSRPLWLVRADGSARALLPAVSATGLAVAPDGTRIAWQSGPGRPLTAATLSPGGLSDRHVARVASGVVLTGWYGRYVALGVRRGSAGFDRVDVWDPSRAYRSRATSAAVDILGLAADRSDLLGLARPAGRPGPACLVRLDPARGLAAGRRHCVPALTAPGRFALSPDGRLLAGATDADHVVVVDIAGGGSGHALTRITCDRTTQQVWADSRTLLIATRSGLLRYRVGTPGAVVLSGPVHGPVSLVPRLGS